MASCVVVLTPNGRRQTVKVTPNTTILQILEEVCKKQQFKAEEYDIKHHRKILDPSSNIRFSGLPNNAQLELITTTRIRTESDVTLGIHFEDGNRILGTFKPSNTLYDVLSTLSPDDLQPEKNCVILYMRQEIFGLGTFKNTDLKSLGLTSGRAMLRLIHRAPEDLKTQANVSTSIPPKPVEEKPYMRKLQRIESPVRTPQPLPQHDNNFDDNKNLDQGFQFQKPEVPKASIKKQNIVQTIKNEKKKQPVKRSDSKGVDKRPLNRNDVKLDDFVFLGERNAMAFSMETAEKVSTEELPEDFFELTIDDAKKILRDIKRRRLALEEGQLLTTGMRKLEESKKQLRQLNTYKKSIIRIQFPDRTVLQGTFLPVDEIATVIDFVKEYLEDHAMEFYLYTTPPKNILKKESRLIEIGCVPGAVLHFGTNGVENQTYLRSDLLNKFTKSSMASLAASIMRQQATRSNSTDSDDLDEVNDVNVGASTSAGASVNYVDYDKPSTSTMQEKVPKWFKPTK